MAVDMNPPAEASDFLARSGWGDAAIQPLAGDASFRRYFRVVAPGRSAVLMDAPPPQEDPRPFIAIAEWLSQRGFAAPQILARDLDHGLVLLQDFGDARMRETVDAAPESELRLYEAAVDLLVRLAEHEAAPVRPYDRQEYQREVGLFTEWYCPAVGLAVDGTSYRAAWDAVLDRVPATPPVTVLRDYHAENIMLIDRPEVRGLGLLDFQDALAGHPAYDLVSLLQDARRDVGAETAAACLRRYLDGSGLGAERLEAACAVLGAQRNLRILGVFARLAVTRGNPRYIDLVPRVWRHLERDLAHPALAKVRGTLDVLPAPTPSVLESLRTP